MNRGGRAFERENGEILGLLRKRGDHAASVGKGGRGGKVL